VGVWKVAEIILSLDGSGVAVKPDMAGEGNKIIGYHSCVVSYLRRFFPEWIRWSTNGGSKVEIEPSRPSRLHGY